MWPSGPAYQSSSSGQSVDAIMTIGHLSGATALVVDDEVLVRLNAVSVLEDGGWHVLEASNADEALRLLERENITLLITDVMMPGTMDGLELARVAHERWSLPTIIISAVAEPDSESLPRGALFLRKPYSDQDLERVTASLLGQGRAVDQGAPVVPTSPEGMSLPAAMAKPSKT